MPTFEQSVSGCPGATVLAACMEGSLAEADAERVFLHLENCQHCQQQTDELARRQDSLAVAMQKTVDDAAVDGRAGLSKLIADAQNHPPSTSPSSPANNQREATRSDRRPVTLEGFAKCLAKSGLMSPDEAHALIRELAPSDSTSLADSLVARSRLTPFQARALLLGRWRGLVLGDYAVLEPLGKGGMGRVFKAEHRGTKRIACVKVMSKANANDSQYLDRFRREAKLVSALRHPHIVESFGFGEADGIPYLVMEFVQGSDLSQYIKEHGPLSVRSATDVVRQTARGMDYAHRRGVVHRDIKPGNLLADARGHVRVLDLGLARLSATGQSDEPEFLTMTQTGQVMGTVDFVAPEQAMDARDADARSDIYSLGCTLHYLLTGRPPFAGGKETLIARLVAHRERDIPSLRSVRQDVPEALDAIFMRMMAKNPSDRYQSMAELARDLEAVCATSPTVASPAAASTAPTRPPPLPAKCQYQDTLANQQTATLLPMSSFRRRHLRRRSRTSLAKPLIVVAALLLAGIALWVFRSSIRDALPIAAFHRQTLAEGGPGRVMVVLPPDGFSSNDYQAVTQALGKRGVKYLTASTKREVMSSEHRKRNVDLTLNEYDPGDFDAVFFCGGNSSSLISSDASDKNSSNHVIAVSLKSGQPVVGIGEGWTVLHHTWKTAGTGKWDCKSGGEVGTLKDQPGHVVKVCDWRGADSMVAQVFDNLLATPQNPFE